MEEKQIKELMDSQADLQFAIGVLRLDLQEIKLPDGELILERMYRSLGRQHKLLSDLGKPMYDPQGRPPAYADEGRA